MAMNVGGSGEGQSYSDINMTPLIDVMLVLLIIFIITIPGHDARGEDRQPAAAAAEFRSAAAAGGRSICRSTSTARCCGTARRSIARRCKAISLQEATKDPQPEVHITVDKFAKYEKVAQTLADLQSRGLKKIGFVNNDFF
jgi:biopolymer transport protein ExbD